MKFFINSSFNQKNSGIEHAQLKRAKLFRDHGEAFKMIFGEWNPRLHHYLNDVGVADNEILSMFDFFQDAEQVEDKIVHAQDLRFGVRNVIHFKDEEKHLYNVQTNTNQLVARVHYYTEEDDNERVSMVEIFDAFGNLYRVDNYDFRGFLSLTQWYTPDNKIGTEVWYDVHGKPVLESFNRYNTKKEYKKEGWRLTFGRAIYMFPTIDELMKHFYNLINEKYWSDTALNVFILDRTHLGDWSVLELDRPVYTVLHLHNSHAGDAQDTMHSVMNNFYEYGLTNINRYDAVVSATQKQTRDVMARFKPQTKCFTIPVGIIPDAVFDLPRVPMAERDQHSVVMTCRVAPEKNVGLVARSIGLAKAKIPDINLTVYGYIDHRDNDAAKKAIDAAIEEFDLQDAVKLYDYTNDVASVQRKGQVYALASVMEGFNLSLMEAQSNGMVSVTYDVNYGPNDLVVDQENGYVIPFNEGFSWQETDQMVEAMAEKFVELFSDADKLQAMSDKAFELSDRFSEANVWAAWQELLTDANEKAFHYVPQTQYGLKENGE
ncbi:glycosyltransferase [Lactococcus sp.]|uniref:glycosyltransferase n=1 Tax=Lactococcus sp. TaxID=44273 RepID=UPI0035B483D3